MASLLWSSLRQTMPYSTAPTWLQTPPESFSAKLRNAQRQHSFAATHIRIGSSSPMPSVLLTTRLYIRPFKEGDCLTGPNQTWIALCTMIQEAFQQHLNVMAPTAGHHGYALAMPHQQNAFGVLGQKTVDSDNKFADTVTTQVAALTYQSQLTASTVADLVQHAEQQFAHLALQQNLMH
jgi:hypothetical protein